MFDIGFPELVLITIVALLVIGPEKLPHAIRTMSLWIGRLQRSFAKLRSEFENEIGSDEIRQQLHNESIIKELKDTQQIIQDTQRNIKQVFQGAVEDTERPPSSARSSTPATTPATAPTRPSQTKTPDNSNHPK